MSSIVIGLVVGYAVAYFMGMIDFSSVQSYSGVNIPVPFKYGLAFSWSSFIAVGLIYMITAIEAYGDITANSMISGEPVEGEKFIKRASGGILADGFNSFLAGAFNSFPNSVFAPNNGMIQLTGVEMCIRDREESLFSMIKKTPRTNPNRIVSAYKDNCAFICLLYTSWSEIFDRLRVLSRYLECLLCCLF